MNVINDLVPYLGYAVMLTGLAHVGLGLVIMRPAVNEILKQGVYGVVKSSDTSKMTFLWFEAAGLGLFVGGVALHSMLQTGIHTVPWLFVISFLLTAIFVGCFSPEGARGSSWLKPFF